jgi:uncharacterized membrane protein
MRRLAMMLKHRLRTSLWFIPLVAAIIGIVLSVVTLAIDHTFPDALIPRSLTGDPNAALVILSTIAASMVSLTALVLTITSVVVQLAMGQFSPRSVRPFLQDRPSQIAIGVFVGTFAHAMLAMRAVESFGQQGTVPGLTIVVSYTLVIIDIVVLVAYVHHIGNSLKVDSIIQSVGVETRQLLDKLYPDRDSTARPTDHRDVIASDRAGTIFLVDHGELVTIGERAGGCLTMAVGAGSFVPEGAPLFWWDGENAEVDHDAVRRAVAIGPERTMDQDAAFGIQTLADIGERALSESFNDQTTAAQVVDRLHDILRQLSARSFPTGAFPDANGVVRLRVPMPTWDDYVSLAFDDLTLAAQDSPSVIRRIRRALEDLVSAAPEGRREPLAVRLSDLVDENRAKAHQPV